MSTAHARHGHTGMPIYSCHLLGAFTRRVGCRAAPMSNRRRRSKTVCPLRLLAAIALALSALLWAQTVTANERKFAPPAVSVDRGQPRYAQILDPNSTLEESGGSWVCLSASSPENGACPTALGDFPDARVSTRIKLRFKEQRTGDTITVTLDGFRVLRGVGGFQQRQMNDRQVALNGTSLSLSILPEEWAKFPYGGIWTARLVLNQHQLGAVFPWTIDITVRLTDSARMAVLFPGAGDAPKIDLNLQRDNGPKASTHGTASIDMCLYDGFNSNSISYEVTITDALTQSPPTRRSGMYSVVREGASQAGDGNRVDYQLFLDYRGQPEPLENGKPRQFQGLAPADGLRRIRVLDVGPPVYCVPARLTLKTPPFNTMDKASGPYAGKLRVLFSPSL